jgi:hypothetical protein
MKTVKTFEDLCNQLDKNYKDKCNDPVIYNNREYKIGIKPGIYDIHNNSNELLVNCQKEGCITTVYYSYSGDDNWLVESDEYMPIAYFVHGKNYFATCLSPTHAITFMLSPSWMFANGNYPEIPRMQ